ncbi:MAG: hypothetical protein ACYDCK_12180 [Thermoplasmatota archaeon]
MRRILALLALTTLLAPSALAHTGGHGTTQVQPVGDALVLLGLTSVNATFAEFPTPFLLDIRSASSGAAIPEPNASLVVRDQNTSAIIDREAATFVGGTFRANLTFPTNTTYAVWAFAGNITARFNWTVLTPTPYRVISPNAIGPWYANTSLDVRFDVFDARINKTQAVPNDASLRVEHWTNDHKTILWTRVEPLVQRAPSELAWTVTVPEPGMYHVYFQSPSLNLSKATVPMVHVFVYNESEKPPSAKSPVPDAPLALGLVALALVALARGRRA